MAEERENEDAAESVEASTPPPKPKGAGLLRSLTRPIRLRTTFRCAFTVAGRDLLATFQNPAAYGLIALYLAGCGLFFFVVYDFFGMNEATVRPLVTQMPVFLAILIPIMTMRTIADERQKGTMVWLQSLPITDGQIVLGKFVASASLVLAIVFASALFPVLVAQVGTLDSGQVLASYIGLCLVGFAYAAVGVLASALVTKPIAALVLGLFMTLGIYGLSFVGGFISPEFEEHLSYVSIRNHFQTVERGVLDSRNVLFYLSIIFVTLSFATLALGRGRSRSRIIPPVAGCLALVLGVGCNLGAQQVVVRADLTRNTVNTLSKPATDVVSKFQGLSVNLYISRDLPDVLYDPVTGEPSDMRVAKQHLNDLLEEFRANAKGRTWIHSFTENIETEDIAEKLQPLQDRGREKTYYFGATLKFGDFEEVLPSLSRTEFQEFNLTRALMMLRRRATGFKNIQDLRNASRTVSKATIRCLGELRNSVTPLEQLPREKRTEPALSNVRIAEYKRRFRSIKDRCHWLSEVSKTISVYAQRDTRLELMRQTSIEAAEHVRLFERSLFRRGTGRSNALEVAKRLERILVRLKNKQVAFDAAPGQRRVGIVCNGTSFCPFGRNTRFTDEELEWLDRASSEFRSIGQGYVDLSTKIDEEVEDLVQHLFSQHGFDVFPIDLSKPVPKEFSALLILGSVGNSDAFRTSKKQVLKNFGEAELYHLDQFLLDEGALAVFLNPWHVSVERLNEDGSRSSSIRPNESNIGTLLSHYGVKETKKFIVEPRRHGEIALRSSASGKKPEDDPRPAVIGYPLVPRFSSLQLTHPASKDAPFIHLPFATSLNVTHPNAKTLLRSSRKAIDAEAEFIPLRPDRLWNWAQNEGRVSHDPLTVAATITGRIDSFFPTRPKGLKPVDGGKQHLTRGQGKLLVVGSSLGIDPLHYDTIFSPSIRLSDIPKDPERHKYLLSRAKRRFQHWKEGMHRLQSTISTRWTDAPRFLQNSLQWLTQEKELENVPPKSLPTLALDINPRKDRGWPARIRTIAVAAGPGVLLFIGLLVFLTKRRRKKWIIGAVQTAKKPKRRELNSSSAKSTVQGEESGGTEGTDESSVVQEPESAGGADAGDNGDDTSSNPRDTDENPAVDG